VPEKVVEVPGMGNVAFPDTMSDEEIAVQIRKSTPAPEKSVGGFADNLGSSAVQFAKDVTAPIHSPVKTLEGVTGLFQGMAEKSGFKPANDVSHAQNVDALMDFYKDRYGSIEGFKKTLYEDPVGVMADIATLASGMGAGAKGAQLAATAAKAGKVASGAGAVARGAAAVEAATDPLRLGAKAAAVPLKLAGKALDATSISLTRGALRGGHTTVTDAAKVGNAAETMSAGNIPFSQKGLDEISQTIADLQTRKNDRTNRAGAAGVTVGKQSVMYALGDLYDKLERQAFPADDLKQIKKVMEDFRGRYGDQIPADLAESIKEGTYANNRYGGKPAPAHMSATERAEKTIARVLKEELEIQIPELASLNVEQGKLLDLQGILKTAVNKHTNSGGFRGTLKKELFSKTGAMKSAGVAVGAGYATSNPALGGGLALTQAVLSDPAVKQRLAIIINQTRKANPSKWGSPGMQAARARVAEYAASLATPLSRVPAALEEQP